MHRGVWNPLFTCGSTPPFQPSFRWLQMTTLPAKVHSRSPYRSSPCPGSGDGCLCHWAFRPSFTPCRYQQRMWDRRPAYTLAGIPWQESLTKCDFRSQPHFLALPFWSARSALFRRWPCRRLTPCPWPSLGLSRGPMHPPETFPWLPSERQPRTPLLPVLPYSVQGSLPPSAATTGRDNGTRSAEVRPMAEPPACKPAALGRREVEALGEEAATGMGGGTAVASCALMPPKRVDYWQSSPGRWIVARRLSAKPTARAAERLVDEGIRVSLKGQATK